MDLPLYLYYTAAAVALVLFVGSLFLLRKRKTSSNTTNPYVDALKQMIDGDQDGAYAKLQAAVKGSIAPFDAYLKLGELLRERGDASKALQIHQSLTVKTDLTKREKIDLFLNLADDYAKMGNSDKSVQVLENAIRNLNIKDGQVSLTLAKHHHVLGNTEQAYDALRHARKLGAIGDRELALYLSSAAERRVEEDDLREARKILHRGLRHDDECVPCLLLLGNIAEKQQDIDDAIARWKQVAMLSPQLAGTVLEKLETTLYERGKFGDIEQIYRDVRSARQADEEANLALAAFYKKQGRGEEAIQLLEEYLVVNPESVRSSLLLTSLYARFRDAETVERFLDDSLQDTWQPNHFVCGSCDFRTSTMRWHCPRCNAFDTFSTNHVL